jgi:hypothetical protein
MNNPLSILDEKIYLLCYDLKKGVRSLKFVKWVKPSKTILIYASNKELFPPITRKLKDILLIGPVIYRGRVFLRGLWLSILKSYPSLSPQISYSRKKISRGRKKYHKAANPFPSDFALSPCRMTFDASSRLTFFGKNYY